MDLQGTVVGPEGGQVGAVVQVVCLVVRDAPVGTDGALQLRRRQGPRQAQKLLLDSASAMRVSARTFE
jgi:hypothetical protein